MRYVSYGIAAVTVLMAFVALWRLWRDPEFEALQAEHRRLSRMTDDLIALWRHRAELNDVTVGPVDGSHESLPEDKATEAAFWSLAKTTGIEVDQ